MATALAVSAAQAQDLLPTWNDGTLWVEAPLYTQVMFAFDRVKAMAPDHPEWKDKHALEAVMGGDMKAVAKAGKKGLVEILMVTHAGMTTDEFTKIVSDWIAKAEHPELKRKYTDLTFQPMKELIAYLQDNDFTTYIVSGGGVEFMRPWTEKAYGIVPEQVIGSSVVTEFQMKDGKLVLVRQPKVFSSTTRKARSSVPRSLSAAARSLPSAMPMPIFR